MKQTTVSHGSTESDIISLDAGLRMDGLPALDLWNVVIQITQTKSAAGNCLRDPERDRASEPEQKGNREKARDRASVACGPRYHKRTLFSW